MNIEFYLVTVVACSENSASEVANYVFEETAIFKKMIIIGNTLYIYTDTNSELIDDDKRLYSEILDDSIDVINYKQFKTKNYA